MFSNRVFQAASIFCSAFLLSAISFGVSDEPDLRKEQNLHDIYKLYNSAPTKQESWAGAVSGKTQTYSIQQGDTLWDLSNALFGDSQFWPKVWSLNAGKIENPHEIFPGLTVHFTPGTTGEAPSLAVKPTDNSEKTEEKIPEASESQKKAAAPKISPSDAAFQAEVLSRAEIPPEPPTKKATALPNSVPYYTFGRPKEVLKLEIKKFKRNYGNPEQPLTTFISNDKIEGVGAVTETELSLSVASDFQYIYVKLNSASGDKNLYVIKDGGEVKDPYTGDRGRLIQVQGELELLEKVNSNENVYRAMVKKTVNPIEVGARLMPGPMPRYNSIEQGSGSGSAHIVGGQFATDQKLFGTQAIVFLSGQGLVENQTYPIYKQQAVRNEKTKVLENPRQIGRVKVIKVAGPFATGVVLQASDDMRVGDVTNPGLISR